MAMIPIFPLMSLLAAQVHHCVNLNDMLPLCDYLTIHVPYLPTTRDTINAQTLAL